MSELVRFETWALFAVTETVLSLTPGPAVLLVVSEGLRRGPARAAWSSAGILTANACYFILSGTSLGALLVASHRLFTVVKWLGSGYLVLLGARALVQKVDLLEQVGEDGPRSGGRGFLNAFVVQAANPKALLFFVAILPQFLDPWVSLVPQILILGVTSILVEAVVLLGYGFLAGQAARFAGRRSFIVWTERVGGALLITAGLGLARQGHAR